MSKHNRERRAIRQVIKRMSRQPLAALTPYMQTRVRKHGKRKLKGL